jgi:uncharacterized protein (TIGR03437 family)
MKRILLLLAAAGVSIAPLAAQDFVTGQAARLVVGQKPFTDQNPESSADVLGAVGGVTFANGTLVVADANGVGASPVNHRIMVYRDLPEIVRDIRAEFPQEGEPRCPACIGKATSVLGQPTFEQPTEIKPAAQNSLRRPIGVAFNGRVLAVADTDNNRVLVWRTLPATNEAPADFVVGQPDFTSFRSNQPRALRLPQGVWLDNSDGLWVADTGNDRVLYYGPITRNGQTPVLTLGQADAGSYDQFPFFSPDVKISAESLLSPMSVTTDGTRLYVADLALNRVLIWNSIPTRNRQPADVVVGQPDMTSGASNNSPKLCEAFGQNEDGEDIFPIRCAATLSMPRYALSDGRRLFISDSGNDRVLVFNEIPRENGVRPDAILGQQGEFINASSDSAAPDRVAATDSFKTPHSLAWDGTNLYVADTFNRRVLLYSPGDFFIPISAVRNAASPLVFAQGFITFSGQLEDDDEISIIIGRQGDEDDDKRRYMIKVDEDTTFESLINEFVEIINTRDGGDPLVNAIPNIGFNTILLSARDAGPLGNEVTVERENSNAASLTLITLSGATPTGGQDAAQVAPYALVAILGDELADFTSEVRDLSEPLPYSLAQTQVYFDGKLAPLVFVSPDKIVAQMPVEMAGSNSASGVIRTVRADGRVTVSTPVAVRLIAQNPNVFDTLESVPSPGIAFHFSSHATGSVQVDGINMRKGDKAIININGREHVYVIQERPDRPDADGNPTTDTTTDIVDGMVAIINENDPEVEAFPAGIFATRVRLRARLPGPLGEGIPFSARAVDEGDFDNATVIMTALNTQLCCANQAGAPITEDNPAVPGETIVIYATGLGLVQPEAARNAMFNGIPYDGPEYNEAVEFVSSLAGGKSANVQFAALKRGTIGIYEIHLELNPDMPTNPRTNVTIAQSFQVSNIFFIPVVNPNPAGGIPLF